MKIPVPGFIRKTSLLKRVSTTTRIAFAMSMWGATTLLILCAIGVLTDGNSERVKDRAKLCELFAISCSQHLSNDAPAQVQVLIEAFADRHDELIGAGLRDSEGLLVFGTENHEEAWTDGKSSNRVSVPVYQGAEQYGQFEVAFQPLSESGLAGFLNLPSTRVVLLATVLNFVGFLFLLRRSFRQYDPSSAIPSRVRSAFDTMSESIIVLDQNDRIMLANRRLTESLGLTHDSLQGEPLNHLPWRGHWQQAFNSAAPDASAERRDCLVELQDTEGNVRVYKMNRSAIEDGGTSCGTLISLDDVTEIEAQRVELRRALQALETSKSELESQNEQLQFLATRDPMTGCFNRRSFFESFEEIWHDSARHDHDLSCVMVDVDHFKSINDNHGHATGDEVLVGVAKALQDTAGENDIVCRYGGEEFCVLLPSVDIESAKLAAERIRLAIADLDFNGLKVTASLGCSDRRQDAETAEAMLEQADQSLYHAKRSGRNRVVGFGQLSAGKDVMVQSPPTLEAEERLEHAEQLLTELNRDEATQTQDSPSN
ncbi:MAG: sensor domain-containing diguanylate cyclase [Planctomycetota bacterium]